MSVQTLTDPDLVVAMIYRFQLIALAGIFGNPLTDYTGATITFCNGSFEIRPIVGKPRGLTLGMAGSVAVAVGKRSFHKSQSTNVNWPTLWYSWRLDSVYTTREVMALMFKDDAEKVLFKMQHG